MKWIKLKYQKTLKLIFEIQITTCRNIPVFLSVKIDCPYCTELHFMIAELNKADVDLRAFQFRFATFKSAISVLAGSDA